MKTLYLFSLLTLSLFGLNAQSDTLYINDTHILPMIFPEPIERAVTGHPNYTFGYNVDTLERLGLLQGNPGTDSNLLVLTRDGLAYSYYLVYRDELKISYRFITENDAIGSVSSIKLLDSLNREKKCSPQNSIQSNRTQYQEASNYFLDQSSKMLKSKRRNGIILRLCEVGYFGKQTYVVLEIENKSKIDFEVDFVQIFKSHGNSRKKSSYQKLIMEPLYRYGMPKTVRVGQRERFVFVVPKFTLGSRENLLVELREKRGDREMVVRLK
ncbi:conjugative transposon protein TraN [Muricauda oceani]|uniref:DUF4138 domain-containing protein n=1 Tax=Flagellimonas oceani TaxID=2698672 RepID=A0A6G7J7A0_9FLAO|nr:DUF4138 domain-containing protein [Allomuricauda oceani]MBW8242548.1 conjugative transposon protein TraN [Allomuricauda oceani]QII46307.1 DUF4138 domain-containing protein [Allomuricauda oceani]